MRLLSRLFKRANTKKRPARVRGEPSFSASSARTKPQEAAAKIRPRAHAAAGRTGTAKRKPPVGSWFSRFRPRWGKLLLWCGTAGLMAGLAVLLAGIIVIQRLPDPARLVTITRTPSITVLAADGSVIRSYGDVYGDYLRYEGLPRPLIAAVLATEDRNFFVHHGIDTLGIARAMWANLRAGRLVQGGSTITQQVAKNVFLTPERTIKRKFEEMALAFWLEARLSKQEILTTYMNRVYLGAGNFGVDAASRRYFGKSAREVTIAESALLAGLLKAPSRYAPTADPERAKARARQVIANMVDAGAISEQQAENARASLTKAVSPRLAGGEGSYYFADWVVDQVPEYVGETTEDLVVKTTLDPKHQREAEQAVQALMEEKGAAMNATQAALVSMRDDGAIEAMTGGLDYAASQYNRAVQAKRQPGSSFKLFVYLAALEAGWTPLSTVEDEPLTVGKWSPSNYDGRYRGTISLREAFAESVNTVAVRLSETVGRQHVSAMAGRLGILSDIPPGPSLALGSMEANVLEMTGAYAHVASGGLALFPYAISEITTRDGAVRYRRIPPDRPQVIAPQVVAMMNDLLVAVTTSGTGRGASGIGRAAAGKTGTSQDFRDAWFLGFTPGLTTGVWVGNDDNAPMKKVTGGSLPTQIWHRYMAQAASDFPARDIITAQDAGGFLSALGNALSPSGNGPSSQGDVSLGTGFWDKLFDGEVKHEYPGQ